MQIDQYNESSQTLFFEHIDRIINAGRITEMQELKKLVKFIDHLIQSLIHQIASGVLSEKGAKIKILQLFGIIQHSQIGNHPAIKAQIGRLKQIFESNFKESLDKDWLIFKPKAVVLTSHSINHYVESIKDSQNDPIYSEKPRSLIEEAEAAMEKIPEPKNHIELSKYYLSKLINKKEVHQKVKKHIDSNYTPSKNNEKETKDNRINFSELSHAFHTTITATA